MAQRESEIDFEAVHHALERLESLDADQGKLVELAGPVLELTPIEARIPAQIDAEAQAKNCTHLLYTTVEQKKAGKGMGKMFGKLAPVAGVLPVMGALGGGAGAAARDEITLPYKCRDRRCEAFARGHAEGKGEERR